MAFVKESRKRVISGQERDRLRLPARQVTGSGLNKKGFRAGPGKDLPGASAGINKQGPERFAAPGRLNLLRPVGSGQKVLFCGS